VAAALGAAPGSGEPAAVDDSHFLPQLPELTRLWWLMACSCAAVTLYALAKLLLLLNYRDSGWPFALVMLGLLAPVGQGLRLSGVLRAVDAHVLAGLRAANPEHPTLLALREKLEAEKDKDV
jgi:hypothetical protein